MKHECVSVHHGRYGQHVDVAVLPVEEPPTRACSAAVYIPDLAV